jgi:glycolate oxidase subunit GlcD
MIETDLLDQLRFIVGAGHVHTGRADAEVYSYDGSLAVAAPDAVVLPADTDQTAAVVRAAVGAGVPFVPRGFGTNLSGGSLAAEGGLVIALTRMNRILEIEPAGRYAVVQPGVTNLELQNALAPLGFFYAPDPASQKVATLGGNAAENSGGPHCLKYGVTTNHILAMTAVLADGRVVGTGTAALDPAGYDLRGLLIGSEGTLGIITELVVRILPMAESVLTLLAVYDDVADAARSVADVIAAGIVPATLEMMDATVIRAVEESKPCGYPRDAAAVLIAEVDGPVAGLQEQAEQIGALCAKNGCREVRQAKNAAERDLLWAGRRGAFGAIARLAPSFLVADCTVPRTLLPKALSEVAAIAGRYHLEHGNVFHAGDGNLHPLLLFDSRKPDELQRVHQAADEIMEACVGLGGTITGEHGVGMEKSPAMRLVFSDADLDWQRDLCKAIDPRDLLNPGKVIPPKIKEVEVPEPACPAIPPDGELIPTDEAEACDLVRRAYLDDVALLPLGTGLRAGFGNVSSRETVPLRSTRLTALVEHDPANQTVVAGAGMSLDALQDALAQAGQWLPLRPPLGGRHSLGGLAALAACGPERLRYGAPRDLLLGLKFVSGRGRLIRAGGRVVKNVAGYDVTRLMVGSAGTLGFLTELTFRIASLPERTAALLATGPFDHCASAADDLLRSRLEPVFVVAVPPGSEISKLAIERDLGEGDWQLVAGFEGFDRTVDFQVNAARSIVERAGLTADNESAYPVREGFCGSWFQAIEQLPVVARVDLPMNQVGRFVAWARREIAGWSVFVDFGCGRITFGTSNLTDGAWRQLSTQVNDAGGHVILEEVAAEFAARHDVFGPRRAEWDLTHKIKAALDPHDIFAPGRLPGKK